MSQSKAEIEARRAESAAARKQVAEEIAEIDRKLSSADTSFNDKLELRARRLELEHDAEKHDKAVSGAERELLDAVGVTNGEKTIKRSTFDALTPREKMDFCTGGGRVEDDPEPPKRTGPAGPNQIRREDFDRMSPQAQMDAVVKDGKTVVD